MPSPVQTTKQSGFHKRMQTLKTKAGAEANWRECLKPMHHRAVEGCMILYETHLITQQLQILRFAYHTGLPPTVTVMFSSGPLDPLWLRESNQPCCERCQLVTLFIDQRLCKIQHRPASLLGTASRLGSVTLS